MSVMVLAVLGGVCVATACGLAIFIRLDVERHRRISAALAETTQEQTAATTAAIETMVAEEALLREALTAAVDRPLHLSGGIYKPQLARSCRNSGIRSHRRPLRRSRSRRQT